MSSKNQDYKIVKDFLGNLENIGKFCSIKNIKYSHNPIVIGKIEQIHPMTAKTKFQSNEILIFQMKEVNFLKKREQSQIFKIVFLNMFAKTVSNLMLKEGDFIAIHKPRLFNDSSYGIVHYSQTYVLVIGLHNNEISGFYKRMEYMTSWEPLNINKIKKVAEIYDDHERRINYISPKKQILLSGKSIFNDFLNQYENTKENYREYSVRNSSKIADYEYKKLVDLHKNMIVKLVAIVNKIFKNPTISATGKYHVLISIIDETKTDEFKVHIHFKELDDYLILQEFNIIFFHNLKVEENHGKLEGRIYNTDNFIIIDKENPEIIHEQLKNYTCTPEDYERIKELRHWMLENITVARPITPFITIQAKNQKLNLRCELVDVKLFNKVSTIILRVRDGTPCSIPFQKFPFICDYWYKVIRGAKSCFPTDEIDIVVSQPDEMFLKIVKEKLQIGQNIELYNVNTTMKSEVNKTKMKYSLAVYLIGKSENLKIISSEENLSNERSCWMTKEHSTSSEEEPSNLIEETKYQNNINVIQNDIKNYFLKWPQHTTDKAFYIKVYLKSTIPVINSNTSDLDLLTLINSWCLQCNSYFPFHLSKWIYTEKDGPISICPKCKEKGLIKELSHLLICELLLQDEQEKIMPAIVCGCYAENFFGCSASELCLSTEAKIKVRNHMDSYLCCNGNTKKYLILKVVQISYGKHENKFKYFVLN